MEALEIERQTDQAPLASGGQDSTQGELAEAQHLLDDADHRFDATLACAVDRFAQRCPELRGHLDLGVGVLRRRVRQWREALLPTGMMGITPRGDGGLDARFAQAASVAGPMYPASSAAASGMPSADGMASRVGSAS